MPTPLASISGLSTGLDFQSLVDQIIEIESSRLDFLRVRISSQEAERTAWGEVRVLLDALSSATRALEDGSAVNSFTTSVVGSNPSILSASASASASTGSYAVRVLQKAQREVLASDSYASRTDALGLSGQFVAGGTVIDVQAGDTLQDIAGRVNALNSGPNPVGVSASVVGSAGSYRLVLSSAATGSSGLRLLDVSGVLGSLGLVDGTATLAHRTSGGFAGDPLADATTAVGALLGFTGTAPSGTVTLGAGANAFTVALDLSSMSLEDVRDAINGAAATAGSAMFAEVETVAVAGGFEYRLAVTGEAAATDAGAVLQALGVMAGGRGPVSQTVQGDALTTDAGGTLATAGTALSALFNGSASAGVTVGDTITFQGTDHAGAAFTFTHTVQAGDTIQTLLTRLEGAEGFDGSATATVDAAGRITLTATTAGSSRVSLQAFAGNEGGGILDLGAFQVTAEGRHRQVSTGADALVEIDGVLVTSSSNQITDAVSGVTFTVLGADPLSTADVVIDRDVDAAVEGVTAFVTAFNALVQYVGKGAGVLGAARPPLAGDVVLRGIRDRVALALQGSVPGSSFGSLSELGLQVERGGTYKLDASVLGDALRTDADAVLRIFGGYGVGSTSALTYLGASATTPQGTFDVVVSQLGSAAVLDSLGFSGAYADDATPDTLTLTDLATGAAYDVALTNGMTLAQIVASINAELAVTRDHVVTSARTMYADAGASALANSGTTLANLYHGAGQSSGFVAGTEVTISGTKPDGSTVLTTYDVTDPSTQTLGGLRAAVQSAFGATVSVSISGGQLVVRDLNAGESQLTVSVGSDIPGNAAPFGQMLVTVDGRGPGGLVAEAVGSELRIRDTSYGSAQGFQVAFTAGGSNGSGSLGLAAGSYSGTDVIGTIGGEVAVGLGNVLTGATGTVAQGLAVRVSGTAIGALGSVTYGAGLMTTVDTLLTDLLRTGTGGIDGVVRRVDESIDRTQDRLTDREARLEVRRQNLVARFVKLEEAMAKAQSLQEYLTTQLASLPKASRS
ncbi:MAG: flagellar filament capping protein FliD [Longimicrobiales bacterium]